YQAQQAYLRATGAPDAVDQKKNPDWLERIHRCVAITAICPETLVSDAVIVDHLDNVLNFVSNSGSYAVEEFCRPSGLAVEPITAGRRRLSHRRTRNGGSCGARARSGSAKCAWARRRNPST